MSGHPPPGVGRGRSGPPGVAPDVAWALVDRGDVLVRAIDVFARHEEFDALTVVSAEMVPLGLLSRGDALRLLREGTPLAGRVGEIRLRPVVAVPAETLTERLATPIPREEFPLVLVDDGRRYAGTVFWTAYVVSRLAEEALLRKELTTVLDSTANGILAVDASGVIRLCNAAAAAMIGVEQEPAIGRRVDEVIESPKLLDVVAGREFSPVEKQRVGPRVVLTSRAPVVRDGRIVGAVAVFQDLTELEQVLGQLAETRGTLSQLESVFDNAYEGLFRIDRAGIVTYFNRSMSMIFDLPRDAVIGRHIADVIPHARLHLVAQTGEPEVGLYRWKGRELVVKRIPIREGGEVSGAVGMVMFKDVEEMRSLSAQLNVLERRIEVYQRELEKVWASKYTFEHIIGRSEGMVAARQYAERAAQTSSPVLILGESGTGKELFAHAIHFASPRRLRPFIRVDCSSIPDDLLESELFGHEGGAFTGASRTAKPGKFELAREGTIFLDEIGDMPLDMQAKLLRVLQEHEIVRVGGTRPIPLDFRVIAATNQDLERKVRERTFREDLFYRLDVMRVLVPPLRERLADIPILARHLLERLKSEFGLGPIDIEEEAVRVLARQSWPGNVRQLANVLERVLAGLQHNTIRVSDLPESMRVGEDRRPVGRGLRESVRASERLAIEAALREAGGSVAKAANKLGIHRSVLYRRLRRLAIKTTSQDSERGI